MAIKLILSMLFMFSGRLGALDSNGMGDVVDHEHETLPQLHLENFKIFMTNCYSFLFLGGL